MLFFQVFQPSNKAGNCVTIKSPFFGRFWNSHLIILVAGFEVVLALPERDFTDAGAFRSGHAPLKVCISLAGFLEFKASGIGILCHNLSMAIPSPFSDLVLCESLSFHLSLRSSIPDHRRNSRTWHRQSGLPRLQ